MKLTEGQIKRLQQQRTEALRYLAVLVERAGGEVTILPDELTHDRSIEREEIGYTGAIRLKAARK